MTNKIKLTGLWEETTKDGKSYLSGTMMPGAKLLIFPNSFKKRPTDPDYIAYLASSKDDDSIDSNGV